MKFSEDDIRRAWRNYFGDADMGIDVFGRVVYRSKYEVDHIWPVAHGGINDLWNALPMSPISNMEKGDFLKGVVNGHQFEVQMSGVTGMGVIRVDGKLINNKKLANSL